MKNDFARLGGVAVTSAVLASLLTSSIMVMIVPQSSSPAAPVNQPDNSLLEQLQAQVEALMLGTDKGKGIPFGAAVMTSDKTAEYVARNMSEDYLADNVTHAYGLARIEPNTSHVEVLSFSDVALKDLPVWSASTWLTDRFEMNFYRSGDDDQGRSGFGRRYYSYPYSGILRLQVSNEHTESELALDCGGEYSEGVEFAASVFQAEYLPKVNAAELCQYVKVSDKITGTYNGDPEAYTAYTLDYPSDIPDPTTRGLIMLPTIIQQTKTDHSSKYGSDYTLAAWFTSPEYGYDDVRATVEQLSTDLTTRTVMRPCMDYGGCY